MKKKSSPNNLSGTYLFVMNLEKETKQGKKDNLNICIDIAN
jgi:hypothetical protein